MDVGSILSAAIALIGMCVAGVVWLVRLEGRINTERQVRQTEHKSLLERLTGFEQRIYDVLERIEAKLDSKADKRP